MSIRAMNIRVLCRFGVFVLVLAAFHIAFVPRPALASEPARLEATGELVSPMRSELVARQPGRVGELLVDAGELVRRDQPLLRLEGRYFELEARHAEADLERATAALADAERELERKRMLFDRDSVARAVFDRALAARDQARAAHAAAEVVLATARQRLDDTVLRAPFAGAVAERYANVGEHLAAGTPAFVLVRTAPLEARFRLPERHLREVRTGCAVAVRVEPYPDEVFAAVVHRIGRVIDPATRSLLVEAELANADGRLRPGLFARIELDLESCGSADDGEGDA